MSKTERKKLLTRSNTDLSLKSSRKLGIDLHLSILSIYPFPQLNKEYL